MVTLRIVLACILNMLSRLIPRRADLVVCGAHYGDTYSSNPRYFFEYLARHTRMHCYWVGKNEVRDKLPEDLRSLFVCKGSLNAIILSLRAKYWVLDHGYEDVTNMPIFGRARMINLWHGIPIKRMGRDSKYVKAHFAPKTGFRAFKSKVYDLVRVRPQCYISVSSDKMAEIMEISNESFSVDRVVRAGSSRNDFLIENAANVDLIRAIKHRQAEYLNIDARKRLILYMPTWRMTHAKVFSFLTLEGVYKQRLDRILAKHNAVILEKHHPYTYRAQEFPETRSDNVVLLPKEINQHFDPQELFLIAEVLISDYSSSYIDYALMKRPCIHFAYDLEEYSTADSGLVYRYEDVVAGPIVQSVDALLDAVVNALDHPSFCPARGFAGLVAYESGNASQTVYKELMV